MIKLLLIEDNAADRRSLKRALQKTKLEAELVEAASAREGLELALTGEFDCILLDYSLPDMNGLQFLKELLKTSQGETIPVVMLTGFADDKMALEVLRAGAQDFMRKEDMTPAQLARIVINARERHELRVQSQKAENELRDEKAHFQSVLDTVGDAIIEVDIKGKIRSINKAGQDIFGYQEKEIIGKDFSSLLMQEKTGKQKTHFATFLAGGAAAIMGKGPVEVVGRSKAGKHLSLEAVVSELEIDGQRLFIASMRDITKRNRMQAQAKAAEAQYKLLAEHGNDIIFLHDLKGNNLYISPSVKKHLGHNPAALLRKPSFFLLHPEDKKGIIEKWTPKVFSEKKLHKSRMRLRHADGHYVWFDQISEPVIEQDGTVKTAVTACRNITAQLAEESEKLRLGRIIEDSPHEIYMTDLKTLKFLNVNRGARENLGYSLKELKKMTPLDLKPKELRKHHAELTEPLITGEKDHVRILTKHLRKDRTTYDADILIYALRNEDPPVLFAYVDDVTEKMAIAEKAEHAQKMKTIGNLTGDFAHDFNNHITAIMGSLMLLQSSYGTMKKEDQESLDLAIQSSERCAHLLRALLAFSERQRLKWAAIDVNAFLQEFQPLLRAAIDETIEIEFELSPGKIFMEVDTGELKNTLLNLADNARAAMPKGGHLTIEVAVQDMSEKMASEKLIRPGRYVVISVSDNGVGMTPEIMEQIFEPFFTTREPGHGSGLGLSTVFGFMKQMEGAVAVYSEPAKGTTFRLYFQAAKTRKKPAPKKKALAGAKTKENLSILIVEDNAEVREFTAKALKGEGYNILLAMNGPAALKIIKKNKVIDLLLCDVVLPGGIIGPEIGKVYGEKFPDGGILYTSGYTGKSIEKKGFNIKSDELLSKPYDLEELFERIDAIIIDRKPRKKS
ncbi:MAG: PAS domain S-box protein [Proteobacteria bacterium]|nr:PAS domain S-box protein [Pseudomonadota bacterium]